jgi:MscS family membrane protein
MMVMQEIYQEITQAFAEVGYLPLTRIISVVVILSVGVLARKQFAQGLIYVLQKLPHKAGSFLAQDHYKALLIKPFSFIAVIVALYMATYLATPTPSLLAFMNHFLKTLVAFAVFWIGFIVIEPLSLNSSGRKSGLSEDIREFLSKAARVLVVVLGILSILELWGINVATFLAGLGLFGMAVALAAQDTLKNVFGCVAILMDKVFKKGDWIKTTDIEGIVENIGFRTTTIRQFDKALIHIPNTKIADAIVINFSRMTNRRIRWEIGLTYDVTTPMLENIVRKMRDYLANHAGVETDPKRAAITLYVDRFTDSSINILCAFFTKSVVNDEYMKVKEECLLMLKKIVEEEGASFAFPTTSIHVESIKSKTGASSVLEAPAPH